MKPRALSRVLQQPVAERAALIAEGLGLLVEHVREVRADVLRLDTAGGGRGLAMLEAQLEEEAAKVLILLDLVRLGWSDQEAVARQVGYFSRHLPRCIYAEMVDMRPATFGEVRALVESMRPSLYLDGPNEVDWIFRNQLIARREQTLYVDYVEYDDGCHWETPASYDSSFFGARTPVADLVIALDRLGITKRVGLDVVADLWIDRPLSDGTHWQEILPINRQLIEEVFGSGGPASDVSQDDAQRVLRWGYPLGGLDLNEQHVDRAALEQQRVEWAPEV